MQSEQQLLQSFSNGDDNAIEILIARYEDRLYNLCFKLTYNRSDAEDLYQQTWLKVLQKHHTFFQKSFQNWLYTVCLNAYRDICRKNKHREALVDMDEETLENAITTASDNVSAESVAVKRLSNELLISRINSLPDKHRLPIILYYFAELDYQQSAQVLGLPIGTVKSRLNSAKKMLRMEMESERDV